MVGPIEVKRKGGASVRYWVNYVTSTFHYTMTLSFDFQGQISNELYLRICCLIDVKQKGKSIRYWADCMVLPFDHTHDLDLVVSKVWNDHIWGMWGPIGMELKECESIIH